MSDPGASSSTSDTLPKSLLSRKGTPIGRGARLPSLRGPRDLTLTNSAPKRVFTPNIPVRREKKDNDTTPSNSPRERKSASEKRNSRGGGHHRGKEFVQLQGGVFSDGFAEGTKGRGASRHGGSSEKNTGATAMPVPKYTPTAFRSKEDKEEEEKALKQLLKDDFIDDLECGSVEPVQLPLISYSGKELLKESDDNKAALQTKIKIEKLDGEMEDISEQKPIPLAVASQNKNFAKKRESLLEIFKSVSLKDEGELLFLQFPDCLPASLYSENEKTEGDDDSKSEQKHSFCKLIDLPEGCIGKLQIMKSGNARLQLGHTAFNVELGTPVGFLQDLVSVNVGDNTADLSILGHIKHKVVCTPDLETLLNSNTT